MDSNFNTTLSGHQSLRVQEVLNDDKLYKLLFNTWYPKDEGLMYTTDYTAINEKLDKMLYDFIVAQQHNTLIGELIKVQFDSELYSRIIEGSLNECLGTKDADLYGKWRIKESKTSMSHMKIILINRMYGTDYGLKKNFKPIVTNSKPKPLRKAKYKKTSHYIKDPLLAPLYLLP